MAMIFAGLSDAVGESGEIVAMHDRELIDRIVCLPRHLVAVQGQASA